jgi:putative FmdB family regulatory protein
MPLYDYTCATCGGFREWRPLAVSADPAPCPSCAMPAPRAIAAPFFSRLSRGTRIAHERNEKSAHEPAVVQREALESGPYGRRRHGHNHGARRPWAIGH